MDHPTETPIEPPRQILPWILAFRRALIHIVVATAIFSIGGYFCAKPLIAYLQQITGAKLVAFGLADAFFAFLKLAIAIGLTAALPYAFYELLSAVSAAFPHFSRHSFLGFWIASIVLFTLGILFCINISLPYGTQFLLGYETSKLVALISVKKFVSFCTWVILGFGIVFELPLVMVLLARIGVMEPKKLASYRRYIVVASMVIAAILTPTPDIFNMLLMAAPLYLLFEIGLMGMRLWGKKRS